MSRAIVVLDANIWREDLLLNTPLGVAFIYAIRRLHKKLGLPEVVAREVETVTVRTGLAANDKIESAYRMLGLIMGQHDDYRLPSETDIKSRVSKRFADLDDVIEDLPFTFAHAKGALSRVIAKTPPNSERSQQFKDSAIWEAVLECAARFQEVAFITADKAFFQGPQTDKLAINLENEIDGCDVCAFSSLESYLNEISLAVPRFDQERVAQTIFVAINDQIGKHLIDKGLCLGFGKEASIEPYLTEDQSVLAVSFQLVLEARELQVDEPESGRLVVNGSCNYNYRDNSVTDVLVSSYEFFDADGAPRPDLTVRFAQISTVIFGSRVRKHCFREPLRFE